MQDLAKISDTDLKLRVEKLVRQERKVTTILLVHFAEVDRRKLHLNWGFSSLFEYLTRGLGYSESAAYRRMQAARAMRQIPELEGKIESGSLNLSQITQVQTAVKHEQKETGRPVDIQRKREIFSQLENKNKYETQRILDSELRLPEIRVAEVHKKDNSVELTLRFPQEVYELLQDMKSIYSHIEPDGDWVVIFKLMAQEIKRRRSGRVEPIVNTQPGTETESKILQSKASQPEQSFGQTHASLQKPSQPLTQSFAAVKKSCGNERAIRPRSHISASVRRFIFARDRRRCQFRKPDGRICASPFQLQIDHIRPRFAGGTNAPENLRLLCAAHNRFRYEIGR